MADALRAAVAGPPELSGAVAAIGEAARERVAAAAGRAVIDPEDVARERPLTPDDLIRVASISKLVTTLGLLRLVEDGRLDLDRDVSSDLGFRLRNPNFPDRPITLRLLLSHRSSLIDAGGYRFALGERLQDRLTRASFDAAHGPGEVFSYANLNWGVIAQVMEAATKERFDLLMRRLVLQPLDLDACFNWSGCSADGARSAAVLYRKGVDETRWDPEGPWRAQVDDLRGRPPACPVALQTADAPCRLDLYRPGENGTLFSPQGGLRISVRGLETLGRLLLGQGRVNGVRLLSPRTTALIMTPAYEKGALAEGETYGGLMRCWGLGAQRLELHPAAATPCAGPDGLWGHIGEAYGLWAGLFVDPARDRVYVYAVTGTGEDPQRRPAGASGLQGFEQRLLEALRAAP